MRLRILAFAALTVLVAAACDSGSAPPVPLPTSTTGPPSIETPAHTVSGRPASSAGPFTVDFVAGAATVRVVRAAPGGSLYRVSTPNGTTVFPTVHLSGTHLEVGLSGGGNAQVTVALSSGVPWDLAFTAGVGVIDLTLPVPVGTRTITETSGASTLNLHLPNATPVTVHAVAGAGLVALYGTSHSGVAAGSTFRYGQGANRYKIDAIGGVSSLTVAS